MSTRGAVATGVVGGLSFDVAAAVVAVKAGWPWVLLVGAVFGFAWWALGAWWCSHGRIVRSILRRQARASGPVRDGKPRRIKAEQLLDAVADALASDEQAVLKVAAAQQLITDSGLLPPAVRDGQHE